MDRNISLLYLCSSLSMTSYITYLLLLPQYTEVHNIGELWYGFAVAINVGIALIVSVPGGHVSDKIGRKGMIILGWSISSIALLLLILFVSQYFLLIVSGIMGIGNGLSFGVFSALIADTFKEESLASGYGGIHGVSILVSAGGIFVIQQLIHLSSTYADGLDLALLLCAIIMGSGVVMALLIQEVKGKPHTFGLFSIAQFSSTEKRVIRNFSISQFVIGLGAAMTVPYYAMFFIKEYNTSASEIGIIFTAGTIGMALATMSAGYMGDKINKLRFLVGATALAIPMAFGIVLASTLVLSSSFYVLRFSIANMIWPVWMAFLMIYISKQSRGKAIGIVNACWNLGYIPGAILGGYFITVFSGWAFPFAAMLYLIVMYYVLFDLKRFGITK